MKIQSGSLGIGIGAGLAIALLAILIIAVIARLNANRKLNKICSKYIDDLKVIENIPGNTVAQVLNTTPYDVTLEASQKLQHDHHLTQKELLSINERALEVFEKNFPSEKLYTVNHALRALIEPEQQQRK